MEKHFIITLEDELGEESPRCEAWTLDPDTEMFPAEHTEWITKAFETNCVECLRQLILDDLQRSIILEEQLKYYKDGYEYLMKGLKDVRSDLDKI